MVIIKHIQISIEIRIETKVEKNNEKEEIHLKVEMKGQISNPLKVIFRGGRRSTCIPTLGVVGTQVQNSEAHVYVRLIFGTLSRANDKRTTHWQGQTQPLTY